MLSSDVLDRIDEIVRPGSELNPDDNYLASSPALTDARRRRRTEVLPPQTMAARRASI